MSKLTPLEQLKFNLQEKQYPYFDDEDLQNLLDIYGDVLLASYYGCMMKAQANDEITLTGVLSTKSNQEYWWQIADVFYSSYLSKKSSNRPGYNSRGQCTFMRRVDGQ